MANHFISCSHTLRARRQHISSPRRSHFANFLIFDGRIFRCRTHPPNKSFSFHKVAFLLGVVGVCVRARDCCCSLTTMHKAIYLLSIDTKFNKEKLVYLMCCASYTRDNFSAFTIFRRATTECRVCSVRRTYYTEGFCLVEFVFFVDALEVTLLHTKSHENEKSSTVWQVESGTNTKSDRKKNEFS